MVRLHVYLVRPPDGMEVDHENGDRLDCRRGNMRVVTKDQNSENRAARSDSSTGVRNVMLLKSGPNKGRFLVKATKKGKSYWGGVFDDLSEAEKAAKALRAKIYTHHNEERHD